MFGIEWKKKAFRQLRKLDHQDQKKIVSAVKNLSTWPECSNVKALKNLPGHRLRVGRYRVIFEVDEMVRIITIEEVKKRNERTYSP